MENSLSGESSFSGFDEVEDIDGAQIELTASPSESEKLFVEAARKLSSYEHSLETLVKRFDQDENPISSGTQRSEMAEIFRNSDAFPPKAPGRTDLSAGGGNSNSIGELRISGDRQKYVKIQIPFRTAEIILRILNEDLDQNQRSDLKQAESFLHRARQDLVTVKKLLENYLETSDGSQEMIFTETNEIARDMFTIIDKLKENLVQCQVQNLSELLVRSMKDESRLSMLTAKRPRPRNIEETKKTKARSKALKKARKKTRKKASRSKAFYVIIFCSVACYFAVRLMMIYQETEKEFLKNAYCLYGNLFKKR